MLPTLSTENWITDPNKMMQKIFYYYVTSMYSQSNLHTIKSLQYTLATNKNTEEALVVIEQDLLYLYSKYFTNVTAVINTTLSFTDGVAAFIVNIEGVFKDNKTYNLSTSLLADDSGVLNFQYNIDNLRSQIFYN